MLQVELMRGMLATRSTTLGYRGEQTGSDGLGLKLGVPCSFALILGQGKRLSFPLLCIHVVAQARNFGVSLCASFI